MQDDACASVSAQYVERTPHALSPAVQHMGVDHRRRDIRVAEQLLHRADVVAGLEQVRRKRMAQAMTIDFLRDPSPLRCTFDRFLQSVLVDMMATGLAAARIDR